MKEINDIKEPIEYIFNYWILAIPLFFLISIILFFIFRKKEEKEIIKIEEKYEINIFFEDLIILEKSAKNTFDKALWKKLSQKLRLFISKNYHKKILFMSFWEIKNTKKLEGIKNIFEILDNQFYFYEKKSQNDFLELIDKLKNILDWLK